MQGDHEWNFFIYEGDLWPDLLWWLIMERVLGNSLSDSASWICKGKTRFSHFLLVKLSKFLAHNRIRTSSQNRQIDFLRLLIALRFFCLLVFILHENYCLYLITVTIWSEWQENWGLLFLWLSSLFRMFCFS